MSPVFESRVVVHQRRVPLWLRWAVGLAAVMVVAALSFWSEAPALLAAWGGVAVALAPLLRSPQTRRPALLRVDGSGIWLDGKLAIPQGVIRRGITITNRSALPTAAPVVRLERCGPRDPVDIEVAAPEQAQALLEATRLAASKARATFWVFDASLPARAVLFVPGVALTVLSAWAALLFRHVPTWYPYVPYLPLALALLSLGVAFVHALTGSPAKLVVGADGLAFRSLWTTTRVRYEDAVSVVREGDTLVVCSRDGSILRIGFAGGDDDDSAVIAQRIAEVGARRAQAADLADEAVARAAARIQGSPAHGPGSLTPGSCYRDVPILPEHLWRIVEDPVRDPPVRAGAAAALAPSLDEEGRARLRLAAATSVVPRLRIALEAAADSQVEAQALDEAVQAVARDRG
jgi:hypothetical protein